MKKVLQKKGYTVYRTTGVDIKDNYMVGTHVIYSTQDIKDFGREYSYPEWECDSFEEAVEWIG